MSVPNKDIALSIIGFLKQSVSNKLISEDYADSMDVAIDCIADAFEVDKDADPKSLTKSLPELIAAGAGGASSAAAAEPAANSASVDQETRAKADAFKLEGNSAMAAKNFEEAIQKYTQAIELDNTNAVYLSNRAAAFSSNLQHEKAIEDAEAAIKLNPSFSKSYSRLGLAKYALGDAKAAMEAYKKGVEIEGDKVSDAMKRGYETAKRRVEEELEKDMPKTDVAKSESEETSRDAPGAGAGAGAGAGGMPDFGSMFGGGGGMPSLSEMMNNPQIMQAAQQMMQDPNALANLMNNPMVKNMAQNFGLGGENGQMPDVSQLMNNPALRNMFGGGQGGAGGAGSGSGSN